MNAADSSSRAQRRAGFAQVYCAYLPRATRVAYLLVGDRETAEDLVQEAFLRMAQRFHYILSPNSVEAYLRRTIINLAHNYHRRRRLEVALLRRQGSPNNADFPDVGEQEQMWTLLQTLPMKQRAAVVLRFYEDLSEDDVATLLGTSAKAVNSLVARAM
ncbi:MAG: RNA polymerase sigma factor, partial [Actinomycetota bacterium]